MSLKAAERKKALLCLATHSVRTFSPLVLLLLLLYASNGFSDDGHRRKSLRPSWDGPLWAGQHQLDRLFLPPSNHFNSQFLYIFLLHYIIDPAHKLSISFARWCLSLDICRHTWSMLQSMKFGGRYQPKKSEISAKLYSAHRITATAKHRPRHSQRHF